MSESEIGSEVPRQYDERRKESSKLLLNTLYTDQGLPLSYRDKIFAYIDESPEQNRFGIEEVRAELQRRTVAPGDAKNPRVQRGYEVLLPMLDRYQAFFKRAKANVFDYGSMRYDDPSPTGPDYDVYVTVADSVSDTDRKLYQNVLRKDLALRWPEVSAKEGEVFIQKKEDIVKAFDLLDKGDPASITAKPYEILEPIQFNTFIYSGRPLLITDSQELQDFQRVVDQGIQTHPFVGAFFRAELEDVLNRRIQREATSEEARNS